MRFVVRVVILMGLAWAAGFALFMANVPRADDADTAARIASLDPNETGIVALTGGGLSRIRAAIHLVEAGTGRKVLITGTHPDTRKEELAAYIDNSKGWFDCCVDLGQRALTTRGNALETRDWVLENGFSRIVVVTTDYHMPRATAEIAHALGDVEIIPWPVSSPIAPATGWLRSGEAWEALVTEYNKFILVRAGQLLRLE